MRKYAEVEKVEAIEPDPELTEHAKKLRAMKEAEERHANKPKSVFIGATDKGVGEAEVAKFMADS